jgi:hypothetical protein
VLRKKFIRLGKAPSLTGVVGALLSGGVRGRFEHLVL